MKPRVTPLVRAAAAVGLLVGAVGAIVVPKMFSVEPAFATQGTGFTTTILSRGAIGKNVAFGTPIQLVVKRKVRIKTRRGFVTKTVRIKVPSIDKAITCTDAIPCDTVFQQGTLQPGGSTGWHTHPGPAFVAFAQGEGTYYHAEATGCHAMTVTAGTGFSQMPTETHVLRNLGSVPVVVYTLYVLPHGTPNSAIRTDQPQPSACPDIH
jgi:mannose-6-phosphate isomerase-like protein (cupin superfamily)